MDGVLLMTKLRNMFKGYDHEFHLKNININGSKRGCSGFIKNVKNGKICYINTEVSSATWLKPVLIREAKHLKDYTGGINNFVDYDELVKRVNKILEV